MSIAQALILAIIQGLTEFLPVSSSGHLVIFQKILGFEEPPVFFDILVHVGTLGAILVFFRDKIFVVIRSKQWLLLLALGTLPVCFVGFFLGTITSQIFNSTKLVGFSLFVTSLILFSTSFVKKQTKKIEDLSLFDVLIIGVFQALALLPGISRSGATISAGLWRGLEKEAAFEFSIFLGILAILGAFLTQLPSLSSFSEEVIFTGILGMITAGISGYFSLGLLKRVLRKGRFFGFGVYCAVLGLVILFSNLIK